MKILTDKQYDKLVEDSFEAGREIGRTEGQCFTISFYQDKISLLDKCTREILKDLRKLRENTWDVELVDNIVGRVTRLDLLFW